MKKLLISLVTIGAVAGIGFYATNAFFSDQETSAGNTFTAGSIDLKVSSTCHYFQNGTDIGCDLNSSWVAKDLTTGDIFFNFNDIKPGDYGENTIDLDVVNNDAWMCAGVKPTEAENTLTGPEIALSDNATTGELGQFLTFAWWADNNGNNILDSDEHALFGGPVTLSQMENSPQMNTGTGTIELTLADNRPLSIFPTPGPIPGGQTRYLAVGWCFGKMTLTPGTGRGFTCEGNVAGDNIAQTDSAVADISFSAVQARNNSTFLCPESARLFPRTFP